MRATSLSLGLTSALVISLASGCSQPTSNHEHATHAEQTGEHDGERGEHAEGNREHDGAGRGEHDSEGGGEHGSAGEGGEESGTQYGLDDIYDVTRRGVRLVLQYDKATNSFVGTVENTTEEALDRVRVEVHLSNGTELGPTEPVFLQPGAQHEVALKATEASFERWSAHPEVGSSEHTHEGGDG